MSTKNTTGSDRSIEPSDAPEMAAKLIAWYRANRRDLPWRRLQDDPYAVWVSEIMLQQTQVATVIPYFEKWMERFPSVESLAIAPLEDVLSMWVGLGYYARARNLHRAAQLVMTNHGGKIPNKETEVSKLPGIGRYTLGAILSIGFDLPFPIIDANVARVLCRLFKIEGDPKSSFTSKHLWRLAGQLMPEHDARDFNQAMMELGALVCKPLEPYCDHCPLLSQCGAGNSVNPTSWPQIPPGKSTVCQTHVSAIIHRDCHAIMIKRPEHGLWGGLWEFPRRVCLPGESLETCAERAALEVLGLRVIPGLVVGTVSHSVTHHAIKLKGMLAESVEGEAVNLDCLDHRWVTLDEATRLPVSSPQAQLLSQVRENRSGNGFGRYQIELTM